jgi:hypothetical protein
MLMVSTPAKDAGYEIASFVGLGLSSVRDLVIGTVDVVEDGARQSASCHCLEISTLLQRSNRTDFSLPRPSGLRAVADRSQRSGTVRPPREGHPDDALKLDAWL